MQIPNTLRSFEQKTYIVVCDHESARVFAAHARELEGYETIVSDYPPKDGVERTSTMTPSGMHSAEESENIKQVSASKLFHKLNKTLLHALQSEKFERIIFTVPSDALSELKKSLHQDLLNRTDLFLPKLLTKFAPLEILEHLRNL
ncbi:host attachment protein [Candidatus Parcubacteria bacterium]|nr:host attachment protein [Candidatus Parcubacteria bacterium]